MERNNIVHSSILGQGKVNQLGGRYINGRPLSTSTREAIIKLFLQNEKPCNISRRLQVSHGAVSKILNKYQQTGSIQPGQIGGTARTRTTIVHVQDEIKSMLAANPQIQPKEIRSALIKQGRCTKENAPTEASIGRRLTMFKRAISDNAARKKAKSNKTPQKPAPVKLEQPSPPLPYSIDGILGSSSANQANISATGPTSSNTSTSNDDTWTDDEDPNDSRCENRRNRTAFTAEQIKTLEKRFMENMYPTEDDKKDIIAATGLDLNRINTWFSNRRARVRKQVNFNPDNPANVQHMPPPMPQGVWLPQPGPGFPMMPATMGGSPPLPFSSDDRIPRPYREISVKSRSTSSSSSKRGMRYASFSRNSPVSITVVDSFGV